ncbi:DNA primase [Micrococcus luteus]|nr:DNA primase [Micrococcus luteus]
MSVRESRPTQADETALKAFTGAEDEVTNFDGVVSYEEEPPAGFLAEPRSGLSPTARPDTEEHAEAVLAGLSSLSATDSEILQLATTHFVERMWDGTPGTTRHLLDLCAAVARRLGDRKHDGAPRFYAPRALPVSAVAAMLAHLHRYCVVDLGLPASDGVAPLLVRYADDGPLEGTYSRVTEASLYVDALALEPESSPKQMEELFARLAARSQVVHRCSDPNLVPVANGIFDYRTKTLREFDPELVFLFKAATRYVDAPPMPMIVQPDGTDWNPVDWMASLAPDPEVRHLLWEVTGALLRPLNAWDKWLALISPEGRNGKGTLLAMWRALLGPDAHKSATLASFGADFPDIEGLNEKSAILTDENDVGRYLESSATLKSIVTGDVLSAPVKHSKAVPVAFQGLMVQCMNDLPRAKDKSSSFYRRLLAVPMEANFTEATENKAIKHDYVQRPEVLEWVLHHVLVEMEAFTSFSEPAACAALKDDVRDANDPVRVFVAEFIDQFAWDLVPTTFAHDLYKAWLVRRWPNTHPVNEAEFIRQVSGHMAEYGWEHKKNVRVSSRMHSHEPLINEYDLRAWMNPAYNGPDPVKRAAPLLKPSYRGWVRIEP